MGVPCEKFKIENGKLKIKRIKRSERPAVEALHRQGVEIDVLKAAHVDRGHFVARRIAAFTEGVDAAGAAEAMFDDVFIERISAAVLLRGKQMKPLARHEPQERAFARAHRAIARQSLFEFAFGFEDDFSAVTSAGVFHKTPLQYSDERHSCDLPQAACLGTGCLNVSQIINKWAAGVLRIGQPH